MSATQGEIIDAIERVTKAVIERREAHDDAHRAGLRFQNSNDEFTAALANLDAVRGQSIVRALPGRS